jgi:hypothetical protein
VYQVRDRLNHRAGIGRLPIRREDGGITPAIFHVADLCRLGSSLEVPSLLSFREENTLSSSFVSS